MAIIYCAVPENIHIYPLEGHWKFQQGESAHMPKFVRAKMAAKLEFPKGWEVQTKNNFCWRGVGEWIYSGTFCITQSTNFDFRHICLSSCPELNVHQGSSKDLKERGISHIAAAYGEPWYMKGILLLNKLGIMRASTQVHMYQHCFACNISETSASFSSRAPNTKKEMKT